MELVCGQREHIYVHCLYVYFNVSDSLYGIRVKDNACFLCDFAYLGNRHNRTDFVVGKHNAYHYRCVFYCGLDIIGRNHSVFVNGKVCDLKTLLFQILTGV